MDAQMKRGFLEACVLATLCKGESYGYQIIKDIPESLDLTESTLYPLLKRLESAQCISVRSAEHKGRLRKYYQITQVGIDRIEEFIAERQAVEGLYSYVAHAAGEAQAPPKPQGERLNDGKHGSHASEGVGAPYGDATLMEG